LPLPRKIETVFDCALAMARSGKPSLLKSAVATASEACWAFRDTGAAKLGTWANAGEESRKPERTKTRRDVDDLDMDGGQEKHCIFLPLLTSREREEKRLKFFDRRTLGIGKYRSPPSAARQGRR